LIEPDNYTDDEGPEQIPGFLGLIFDGNAAFEAALAPLKGFDFWTYAQLADELEAVERCIVVDFGSGATELCFQADSVDQIVGAIPAVDALYDCPDHQGPAGGAGHVLVMADGFSDIDVTRAALGLRAALDSDLAAMSACLKDS
jgi:hypothetical protein